MAIQNSTNNTTTQILSLVILCTCMGIYSAIESVGGLETSLTDLHVAVKPFVSWGKLNLKINNET